MMKNRCLRSSGPLLALALCTAAATAALSPSASVAQRRAHGGAHRNGIEVTYGDNGYLEFVNRVELPNTIFHLRGHMVVRFGERYVQVEKDGVTYVIPRERLIYSGREFH